MKFNKLSDKAKERARDWWRQGTAEDGTWYEHVYTDTVEVAKRIGIMIGTRYDTKKERDQGTGRPTIFFSGFYTQGSGCCFEGILCPSAMKDAFASVKDHAPQDEWLHQLGKRAEELHTSFITEWVTKRLGGDENVPDADVQLSIVCNESHWFTGVECSYENVSDELNEELTKFVQDFARWIYKQLEEECAYQDSAEVVDQALIENDYSFDFSGTLI